MKPQWSFVHIYCTNLKIRLITIFINTLLYYNNSCIWKGISMLKGQCWSLVSKHVQITGWISFHLICSCYLHLLLACYKYQGKLSPAGLTAQLTAPAPVLLPRAPWTSPKSLYVQSSECGRLPHTSLLDMQFPQPGKVFHPLFSWQSPTWSPNPAHTVPRDIVTHSSEGLGLCPLISLFCFYSYLSLLPIWPLQGQELSLTHFCLLNIWASARSRVDVHWRATEWMDGMFTAAKSSGPAFGGRLDWNTSSTTC